MIHIDFNGNTFKDGIYVLLPIVTIVINKNNLLLHIQYVNIQLIIGYTNENLRGR